jgi:hypothetical protein
VIRNFLSWGRDRVKRALADLAAIDSGDVFEEAMWDY